jgi:hypothetical protein
MATRRDFLSAAALLAAFGPASAKARLGDDGLFQMDWYLESFLDLAEDLAAASGEGKRFAILWGLRNCPACRIMHQVHLADPTVEGYIRANFVILHLNILGAREVTDFDGSRLTEKALAARYAITGTPAIQFFPADGAGLGQRAPGEREVARMASLPDRDAFLALFRAVREAEPARNG